MVENNDNADIQIQISGEIDLSTLSAQSNGLCIGEGTGEMQMTLNAEDGKQLLRVKLHKLSFEGTVIPDKPEE